jgi:hypothetical protein
MKKNTGRSLAFSVLLALVLLAANLHPALADIYLCSGGTVTTDSTYIIHTFTSSGTFTCSAQVYVDILIVGGGGSGGGGKNSIAHAGGGGGGGVLSGSMDVSDGSHTVIVGTGGPGGEGQMNQGANGNDSSFDSYVAYGGGGGGGASNSGSAKNGLPGGSGGGGGGQTYGAYGSSTQTSQSPMTGYGNIGHAGQGNDAGGGGGGAGGAGGVYSGGTGLSSSISGSSITYAAGGTSNSGSTGTNGRGSGGGGLASGSGSSGGSGVVIIRYPLDFTPGPTDTPTDTVSPTNTPSPTFTATVTDTPTLTVTPTNTTVPTDTLTPTLTLTSTLTITPSPTNTVTSMPSIIWAPSPFSISTALENALAARLIAAPPSGSSENVYGVISAQTDGSGGWYVSLVNIVGVDSPYTGWDALANAQWTGSLDCSGTEPTWDCEYYTPAAVTGGSGGLVFPWQSGTYAIYGQEGVHHDVNCTGGCALPGDDAVDFVSGDSLGSGAMPPYAYAAQAGTVIWSCQGAHNGGIILSSSNGKFMYFHLAPGQSAFTLGTTFQQGEAIGRLAYGTFNDTPCGWASQGASSYHLHFAWVPSGNTFLMGGCILDLATQNWLCGTTTIGVLGHLMNSGNTSPGPSQPTPTPGGPTVTPSPNPVGPTVGGEHIWNGLISAVVDFIHSQASAILPTHTVNTSISDAVNNAWSTIMDFGWMVNSLNMIWIMPGLIVWGIMLTIEIVRWLFVAYRTIVRLLPAP